jgi:hypothetical protein
MQNNLPTNAKRKAKLSSLFYLVWLMSFLGGFIAKVIYEINQEPDWLNSVVVGMFMGLGLCSMSVATMTSNFIIPWNTKPAEKKGKAIFSLVVCVPIFLLGLFVLQKVSMNLWALLS